MMPQPQNPNQEVPCKLDIIIVGCGISGLSLAYYFGKAGHSVIILEAASVLSEIGAGVLLGPNVSKLLIRWGLKERLEAIADPARDLNLFVLPSDDTGDAVRSWNRENMEKEYGGPQYQIHRGDLQKLLCDLAFSFPNVSLRLNSRVVSISPNGPSPYVVLHSGESISGDMVIGADGVKSIVRSCVVGGPDEPTPSGDAFYRVVLSTDAFLKDPDLKPFVEDSDFSVWMGQGKRAVGYCVRARKEYNLALSHPDTDSTESWTAVGNVDEMRRMFEGWDPRLQKILALVPSVLNFRLLSRDPLKSWIHSSGLVTLIGDACHPMMPYLGQGGAMAIEDAAVLGQLFARITSKSDIPTLLKGYESIRLGRATEMQLSSLEAGKMHRSDPVLDQRRDIAVRNNTDSTLNALANPIQEKLKPEARGAGDEAIYGYDAEQVAEDWKAHQ
ncbi:hypothetical protein JOM56_007245 [Amanita muscaria]